MTKLEPCPFCQSENVECIGGPKPYGYNVQCHDCSVKTPYFKVADKAIAAWNHRAPPASQSDKALVEELQAYFRKPEYTLPPYVENLLDRVEARIASARAEGRREGIEEAARWVQDNWPHDKRTLVPAIRALAEKQP